MMTLQSSSHSIVSVPKALVTVEWPRYVKACDENSSPYADTAENSLRKKRDQAIMYIGSHASAFSETYTKSQPRVFTQEYVSGLGAANSVERTKRNPWLVELLDASNDNITSLNKNVLPFGPQISIAEQPIV